MELVRIALERGRTAGEAVTVMGDYIEHYGQWGAGVRGADRAETAYDNSYLVADSDEAWVVETSGRRWVTRRITEPSWSISNEATIRTDWNVGSVDLIDYAERQGWVSGADTLDFAETFLDPRVPLQVSHIRLQRSRQLLDEALRAHGDVDFDDARRVLSDHYEDTFLDGPTFNAARPDFHTLCMHDHPSGFTWGNTAASMIAILPPSGEPVMWWAAAPPCVSVYLPVFVSSPALPEALGTAGTARGCGPNAEDAPEDGYTADSYWWAFQRLLEVVVGDDMGSGYRQRQPVVRDRLDAAQRKWLDQVDRLGPNARPRDRQDLTARCAAEAFESANQLAANFSAQAGAALEC